MSTALAKAKAKRARRPIYMVVRRLVDPETGEQLGALVPMHPIDARLMRERKFHVDREIRAELKQPRNPQFHRLAHAIGNLLVDNVEEFRGMQAHDALKRVQLAADVCCEEIYLSASPVVDAILAAAEAMLGAGARKVLAGVLPEIKTIPVKQARSLAFDELEEDEFRVLFDGVVGYIAGHYASVMLDDVRGEFWDMVNGDKA